MKATPSAFLVRVFVGPVWIAFPAGIVVMAAVSNGASRCVMARGGADADR
ncbi:MULTISPECIES: hypothetical protein [Burkholderia]|uniref:Uncharacterized protein n=1 Tax=Burkholderia contaminans TaxID=488447 RepID=A0AAP1UZV3_9BURK|nr:MULTISPECIES: hypothetical protein [Burkholderia]UTP25592.1 hypothetical protein NMB33_20600 [Burkholderia sp. FXe9]MBH9687993.1 hypothetical protein [Burkholderia contaminans]MBK1898680.1 hypothetical protein [Burkholderia contaminans]MBK1906738.1 hypothetical protein [Burkholderia contaminans]MBK1921890.1 hypothetical protein [Burkholderia contaminans]